MPPLLSPTCPPFPHSPAPPQPTNLSPLCANSDRDHALGTEQAPSLLREGG